MIVVYPIGIPVMYGVLLYRNRRYLQDGNVAPVSPAAVDTSNPLVTTAGNNETRDEKNSAQDNVSQKKITSETNMPDSVERLRFLWIVY